MISNNSAFQDKKQKNKKRKRIIRTFIPDETSKDLAKGSIIPALFFPSITTYTYICSKD